MALTKITGQVINDTTGLVVGVTTVGGGVSAVDGFFSGIVTFSNDVSIAGTLTYEDVTNIDSVGLVTARNGIVVGSGITLSKDGDIFATGITTISENLKVGTGVTISPDGDVFATGVCTATSFSGDGSNLTGISAGTALSGSTDNTVCTVTGANAIQGESNLTFNGTTLDLNGKFENTASAGGDYVAKFQNLTAGTPYTVQIKEPGSATAGYPLIQVANSDSSTEYFRVDSARGVTKLIMHDGAGIDFSNTTGNNINSSSASAHLLDDYEEGTWTPKIKRYEGGGWVDATMTSNGTVGSAIYRKIGGVVHFQLYWNGWQQSNSNYAVLGGLPYAAVGGGFAGVTYTDAFTTNPTQAGMISNGGSQIEFYVSSNQWNNFSTSSSRTIYVSGTYMAA